MHKKSQIGTEFLIIFGWTLLIIFIAVNAFTELEINSTEKVLPRRCVISPGLICIDFKASAGGIQVLLQNGLGYQLENLSVSVTECGTASGPATLSNGDRAVYSAECSLTGTKYNGYIRIDYASSETGVPHTAMGSLITYVEGR